MAKKITYDITTGTRQITNVTIQDNTPPSFRIAELKQKLLETDYKAIKHSEGLITDEDYQEIKEQREAWRAEINELENQV